MRFRLEDDGELLWIQVGLDRAAAAELIASAAQFLSNTPSQLSLPVGDTQPPIDTTSTSTSTNGSKATGERVSLTKVTIDLLDELVGKSWRDDFAPIKLVKWGPGQRAHFPADDETLRLLVTRLDELLPLVGKTKRQTVKNERDRVRIAILDRAEGR